MGLAGDFLFEAIDLDNTSGAPNLNWVYSEGTLSNQLGNLTTNFQVKFANPQSTFSIPVLTRGIGTETAGSGFIPNPRMNYNINGFEGVNYSWTGSSWSGQMIQYGYETSGQKLNEPGEVSNPYFGIQTISIVGESADGVGDDIQYFDGSVRARTDILRLYPQIFDAYQTNYSGLQQAWISYDVSSGVTNNKLFAYSIEILERISGAPESGSQFNIPNFQASDLLFYSGFQMSGVCNAVSLFIGQTGLTCELDDQDLDPDEPIIECLPSGLNQDQINQIISQVLSGYINTQSQQGYFAGNTVPDSEIQNNPTSLQYVVYQGAIQFNNPYSGDYICFSPYSYDYTGEYMGEYGVNPPYPESGFCLTFGVDYTGIDQLISGINKHTSGVNWNLWVQDIDCVDTSLSGLFETGDVLKASKGDSNTILLQSTRIGTVGRYSWTFYEADRPTAPHPYNNSFKYLLPSYVAMQGANIYGNWTTLDARSGVNWNSLSPIVVQNILYDMYTGFDTGNNGMPTTDSGNDITVSGQAIGQLVYKAIVSGTNKCGTLFQKEIDFYSAPSGTGCDSTGLQNLSGQILNDGFGMQSGTESIVDYYFLKTGWKFTNNSGYNYYRIVLDQFISTDAGQQVVNNDSFFISSVNLYGYVTGIPLHSGDVCLVGSHYTGQIQGYTTGIISGTISGEANESGALILNNFLVTGTPNYNGSVTFQYSNGKAVSPFSGLVNANILGSGFYIEEVQGNYYNSTTMCLEFTRPVSGSIIGSGEISGGPYAILSPSYVSGLNQLQNVSGSISGLLIGVIPNFLFNFTNVEAFSSGSGFITQTLTSGNGGFLQYTQNISIIPSTAYSIALSGTEQAVSVLKYNTPQTGDSIYINGVVSIFSMAAANTAPTYYNNINTLTNIINSGSSYFGATGYNDGTNIYLTSIFPGTSGNSLTTSSTGSINTPHFYGPTFSGGQNYYFPLGPTSAFTGQLNTTFTATGFFSGLASGYISGEIPQLDFVRHFTGIWDITTGTQDFRQNNWITGSGATYQNSGFQTMGYFSGQPTIIPILISYVNNPLVVTNDLAILTISGIGLTGLQYILSGNL